MSSSTLNNFLSHGGFVPCAFLGSFWPLIMHSCIRLYSVQNYSYIGQISVVFDTIVNDTQHFFPSNICFSPLLGVVVFLFSKICKYPLPPPLYSFEDCIIYKLLNSHFNVEVKLFQLITWSLQRAFVQHLAAMLFLPFNISSRCPEEPQIMLGSLPNYSQCTVTDPQEYQCHFTVLSS